MSLPSAEFERGDNPPLPSVPPILVEPDVPNPFSLDDSDSEEVSPVHDLERSLHLATFGSVHSSASATSHVVPLETVSPSQVSQSLISPNLNKDVPPPPSESESNESEDIPDIIEPGLIASAMFLPIPNTDPLTTLLMKYIPSPDQRPVRDLTGDWQRSDFHTLVMTNSWRALAKMARDRIVKLDPAKLPLILSLWYIRLSSLARLRLFNQTSAECTNLFSTLNSVEPPSARDYIFDRVLPFELEVMYTRLKYWAGEHMGYLDALNALLKKCKLKARMSGRKGDTPSVVMWQERGSRVSLMIASQLVEMKEFVAAAKHLEPLCVQGAVTSPAFRSAIARIYLQGGYIAKAVEHIAIVDADTTADENTKNMNAALLASAQGEWASASEIWKRSIELDSENYAAVNDLSVSLLGQGRLKEGIEILETALATSPSSVVVAEPFLFNLSTLYELRSATAADKKRALLVEVAKWSGDGLKTTCLKMPSS